MATESSNLYAPPKSAVKDVVGDETFELASRAARLGAALALLRTRHIVILANLR